MSVVFASAHAPLQPMKPWAAGAPATGGGERQPVRVTLMMTMSDFGRQPGQPERTDLLALPSNALPSHTATPTPREPNETTPDVATQLQALNTPLADANPGQTDEPAAESRPVPDASASLDAVAQAEPSSEAPANPPPPQTQDTKTPADMTTAEARAWVEEILPAASAFLPSATVATNAPRVPLEPDQPSEPEVTTAQTSTQPQSTPNETLAEATNDPPRIDESPEKTDPPSPAEAEPIAQADAPPNTTNPAEPSNDASSAEPVYDEDNVDRPITFADMARPRPSSVSRRLGDTGTVVILVEIDQRGSLIRYTVLDDADQPRLLAAAIDALERSTFRPGERDGQPVRSTRAIEYRF